MFDVLVFIGRFQPFHNGHKAVIDAALEKAEHVIVLIGSSFKARDIRNPFTMEERYDMITSVYGNTHRLSILGMSDYPYDEARWINQVQELVSRYKPDAKKIGLIGHSKDHTSYYLKAFPMWGSVEVENVDGINATDIREKLLAGRWPRDTLEKTMPLPAIIKMRDIVYADDYGTPRPDFDILMSEYDMIKAYKDSWSVAPYPPTFVTTDAVVIQSGHILLIERKHAPGLGLWALPGGFVNQHETLLDSCIRELREETKIKVPAPVLRGSIREHKTFDDPNRSTRGRTITTAFLIDLGYETVLPKVKGSDDAAKAKWFPLNEVKQEMMFEDHWHIISHFLRIG